MKEDLLYFVWQLQTFNRQALLTTDDQPLDILMPGTRNEHSGPDFDQARLRINDIEWVGSVEIHVRASDWNTHGHQHDKAYNQVILHVVWQLDQAVFRQDGSPMPTLELSGRVERELLQSYQYLAFTPPSQQGIACASQLPSVNDLTKLSMLEKAAVLRLERKAQEFLSRLEKNQGDWNETIYQTLLRSFGFRVNAEPMEQLSYALPLSLVTTYRQDVNQVTALLLGQAGLLNEEWSDAWRQNYRYLQHKHQLAERALSRSQWRFFRTRPANFPTVRLAQLAKLLSVHSHEINQLFKYQPLEQYYRCFEEPSKKYHDHVPAIGHSSIHNLLINAIIPYQFAYGMYFREQRWKDRALELLQTLPPEKNQLVAKYKKHGFSVSSAFDSQAILELHHHFCQKKQCLSCAIGGSIVKNSKLFVTSISH